MADWLKIPDGDYRLSYAGLTRLSIFLPKNDGLPEACQRRRFAPFAQQ
jgi:hypothetical protein